MKNILILLILFSLNVNAQSTSNYPIIFTNDESFLNCVQYFQSAIAEWAANATEPGQRYFKAKFFADPPVKNDFNNAYWIYSVNVGAQLLTPKGADPTHHRSYEYACEHLVPKNGDQLEFSSRNIKVTDQRLECSKKSRGSIIDFGEKTVAESIPVEGTNLFLNYSSAFNNLINTNRKIKNEYNFFNNIRGEYRVHIYNSNNQQIGGVSYTPIVPFQFHSELELPANTWINNSYTSRANVFIRLISRDSIPGYCYWTYYVNPENQYEYIYEQQCTDSVFFEDVLENTEKSLVLYRAEVWGLQGWTLSEHHYFDKFSKTLFSGQGERIQYSNYKTVNDAALGAVDVVISKYNDQELFIFDPNGRHVETRDAIFGHVIHKFFYDSNNKLIAVEDRFNSKTTLIYDGDVLKTIVSPYGVETVVEVSQNKITKVIDPEGLSYEMQYDNLGLLKTYKSINGVQTSFTYDEGGEFLREDKNNGLIQYFTSVVAGGAIEFSKFFNFGLVRKVIDVATDKGRNSIELDSNGTEISRSIRSNTYNVTEHHYPGESITETFYPTDEWGNDRIVVNRNMHNVTESGQNTTGVMDYFEARSYDAGNVLNLQSYETNTSTVGSVIQTMYDKNSNSLRSNDLFNETTTSQFNNADLLSSISRRDSHPVNFEYDSKGRITKVLKGAQFESYSYDFSGYLESMNNSKNQLTKYIRNKKGQLLTKILPNQDSIMFEYTDGGEVKKITTPNGKVHNFQMSLGDYIASAITPNNKITTYDYDSDKRLKSVVKPSGKTQTYEYEPGRSELKRIVTSNGDTVINSRDIRSRITSITSADNIRTDFTWASGQVQSQAWYENGQLVGKLSNNFAEDQLKIKSIYFNDNLVASFSYQNGILKTIDNLGFTYSHEFGEYYHTQRITNSAGFSVQYTEDDSQNGEQPAQIINASVYDGPQAQLYVTLNRTYDNFGQATEFTTTTFNLVSGTYNTYFSLVPLYDLNNRLVQMKKTRKSFVNGEEVNSIDFVNQYLYPPKSNNNVKTYQQSISVDHAQTPIKRTYASHNDDDQLTKLQGSINRDYAYNEDGELSEMSNCYGKTTYDYDSFGNLKKVILASGKVIEYKVDAFNRRLKKIVNGQATEYYLWYDQTRIAAILDSNKNPKSIYVYGSESENVPGYVIKDGKTYKIIHDPGTQSVRYIVDSENAMIVQESEYDEQGNIMKQTNAEFQPLGFAGGLYDLDTKFVRFGARDYDPTIGRWTTKDPIGFAGGDTNLYAYVGGDPMSYVDPMGLWGLQIGWGLSGFVGFGGFSGFAGLAIVGQGFDFSSWKIKNYQGGQMNIGLGMAFGRGIQATFTPGAQCFEDLSGISGGAGIDSPVGSIGYSNGSAGPSISVGGNSIGGAIYGSFSNTTFGAPVKIEPNKINER